MWTSEISACCEGLELNTKITAILIRHYVASEFQHNFDLTDNEKNVYYKHFGHHEEINSTVYQARPEDKEIVVASKIRSVLRKSAPETSKLDRTSSILNESASLNKVTPIQGNRDKILKLLLEIPRVLQFQLKSLHLSKNLMNKYTIQKVNRRDFEMEIKRSKDLI